jgi:hypothetical protein
MGVRPLKILHVLRSPVGGLFRHVVDLARGQAARSHQVGIVADSSTGGTRADAAFAALDAALRSRPDDKEVLDLRGRALLSAGRAAEAKSAYQAALAKLDSKSPYRNYVQVKLDALGGAPEPVVSAGGSTPPAPAAAPATTPAKGK